MGAPDVTLPDAVHWADPGMFDLNAILDFTPSVGSDTLNGGGIGIGIGIDNPRPVVKQLACARCHAQKLRCVRRTTSNDASGCCDRCLSAGAECINRQPQRMGRPVDQASRSQTLGFNVASNKPTTSRSLHNRAGLGDADDDGPSPRTAQRRRTSANMSAPNSACSATFSHAYAAGPDLEGWPWPSPPRDPSSIDSATSSGAQDHGDPSTYHTASLGGGKEGGPGLGDGHNRLTPQDGFPAAALEDTDALLQQDLDDLPATTFSSGTQAASDVSVPLEEDPVELLSRLHLELYQCLTTVKVVDKLKREKLRNKSAPSGENISTNWSEQLFRTTEQFIVALKSYISSAPAPGITPSCSSTGAMEDDGSPLASTRANHSEDDVAQIDSATGLLIVSCYMRLMQIFETVVFIVETFTEMDCPGSYVQIRFGAFVPTTDKLLHGRMLGQYVLHLLDGITQAVDSAVAARQPYARAIVDVRQAEAKLKERVLTTLRLEHRLPVYPSTPERQT